MKKKTAWLLCAAWMGVIYVMSAMNGEASGGQSGRIVGLLLSLIEWALGSDAAQAVSVDMLSTIVRKGAHMGEYAVLFLLYRRALALSGVKRPGITALVMSACYAGTDEWHQGFVADRNPSVMDVAIDTLGAGIAWGLYALGNKMIVNKKKER